MSLVSRLAGLLDDVVSGHRPDAIAPEALATAAILVHVARVDGVVHDRETTRLSELLGRRFGLSGPDTARLIARAEGVDRDTDDVADLIEMLGSGLDVSRREELLGLAYGVAFADGVVGEFEEDLVWRLGRLLRVDEARVPAIRAAAADC